MSQKYSIKFRNYSLPMNLKKYTEEYLSSKIQVLEVDYKGIINSTDNHIFLLSKGSNIKDIHPFFESIFLTIESISSKTIFSCVEIYVDDNKLMVDVSLIKEKTCVLFIISDFTEHYKESNTLIQERNESTIKKHQLLFEKELLHEKEKLKNTFLAKLSNELRNPLSTIMSLVSLLKESKLNYDQTQIIQLINKTGGHFENLLNDLLDISKISEGKLELKKVSFKLSDIIKYLENLYRSKAYSQQIKLRFIIDPKTPKILIGDPTRLKQILINLLENAFKYTPSGEIKISIKQEYERAKKVTLSINVEDSGSGLNTSELTKVFADYNQIDSLLNPLSSQSLGLKIVEDLVNLQGGQINVKSATKKGTTFHITLPFQVPLVSEKKKKKKYTKAERGLYKLIKILFIDDSEINQLIITKYCVSEGNYKIDLANSQEMAFNLLSKKEYDILLIDLDMPMLDAGLFIKDFKSKYKKTPLLSLSGKALKKDEEDFLKIGVNKYITKPYTKVELFKEINSLVKNS